jgi:hypothetical protein
LGGGVEDMKKDSESETQPPSDIRPLSERPPPRPLFSKNSNSIFYMWSSPAVFQRIASCGIL